MEQEVLIVDYQPQHAAAFRDLNLAWIAAAHTVEEDDLRVLSDPQKYLLADGGAIIIALHGETVVGTCALRKAGEGIFEMTKMTVDSSMRGHSIGRRLCEAIIGKAKQLGCTTLDLYSNRKGSAAAINMYRSMGFKEIALNPGVYARADIKMRMEL
ncbi:MAG: N-acetyltransferase [Chitinophagaceae bacterium]|nr:MAG: N-acetyltransferase [Chitinophagaceae bacterium]